MKSKKPWFLACLVLLVARVASSQETEVVAKPPRRPTAALQVQVILSRYQNEKKISNTPYTLLVTADDPRPTKLRMGIEVPVTMSKDNKSQVQYRTVGTNMDCNVETLEPGRYKVNLNVEQSSVYPDSGGAANPAPVDQPLFRSFNLFFSLLLKDGETADRALATDPVTGEVLKVAVTLNVMK